MKFLWRNSRVIGIYCAISVLLVLAACGAQPGDTLTLDNTVLTGTPPGSNAQVLLVAVPSQQSDNLDTQVAATAEIARANAQATLNSANATLSAAQTQQQNSANVIAAQLAATAEIVRANAQATLMAAGSTQNAAQTQDTIRQTQVQNDLQVTRAVGTQIGEAIITQQSKNDLAAGTQTAIANNIATQTQVAAATSQWYTDQTRQREERRQGPIAFLWMWCLPLFIVSSAGLGLWGGWRWLRIQQANQRILNEPVDKLHAPEVEDMDHLPEHSMPYLESNIIEGDYKPTKPDDQVRHWLDDVKRQLAKSDKKDQDDNSDS